MMSPQGATIYSRMTHKFQVVMQLKLYKGDPLSKKDQILHSFKRYILLVIERLRFDTALYLFSFDLLMIIRY